jgi:hypothetical protein
MFANPTTFSASAAVPLEALVVDRKALVRLMRIALHEMHNRRLFTPQLSGETDIVEAIRYWDLAFDWITQQPADDLVLMSRRAERP